MLCHGLSVPCNHDGFAFLRQFEKARELGFRFMDVDLHTSSLAGCGKRVL